MNKICPYLLAAVYSGRMAALPNYHENEQYMSVAYCRKEECEMWSTTMKACSQRGVFDNINAEEVTKEILVTMLDEKGGLGEFRREGPAD